MKKMLESLTADEIRELINENARFKDAVRDRAWGIATMWIEEFLFNYKWGFSISVSRSDYIEVPTDPAQMDDFENWLNEVQGDMLFSCEDELEIHKYIGYIRSLENNGDELWSKVKSASYDIEHIILKQMHKEYMTHLDMDGLMDEADAVIEDYIYEHGDVYVDEDYNICVDVPEKVIPAHVEVIC